MDMLEVVLVRAVYIKLKNIENGYTIPENDLVNCGGDLKKAFRNACVRILEISTVNYFPNFISNIHSINV